MGLGVAAIGGKDSMSGSFLELDVPPTLISFAIAPGRPGNVLSPSSRRPGARSTSSPEDFRDYEALKAVWAKFHGLCLDGTVRPPGPWTRRAAEAVMKMSFGNRIGFLVDPRLKDDPLGPPARRHCGRMRQEIPRRPSAWAIPLTAHRHPEERLRLPSRQLQCAEGVLEQVYPTRTPASGHGGHFLGAAISARVRPQDRPAQARDPRVPRHQLRIRHR